MKRLKLRFKKLISLTLYFVLSIIFATQFFGCANTFDTFNSVNFNTEVYILVQDKTLTSEQKTHIKTLLDDIEKEFSLSPEFRNTSFTLAFEKASDTVSLKGYKYAKAVMQKCIEIFTLTPKFNPAVYPISKLWQLTSSTYTGNNESFTIPNEQEISALLPTCDFSLVELDGDADLVIKKNPNVKMDLGGVVKGFASEKISEYLQSIGITKGYINVGGSSLKILKTESDLSITHPRKTEVQNPSSNGQNSNEYIIKVKADKCTNQAVSTSGDYVRYYVKDGIRYSHIIDSTLGKPIDTGFCSVTVIGKDGLFCDAITTALSSMTKQEFIEFCTANLSNYQVYGVYNKDGEKQILTNKKQGEFFTLLDNSYSVVKF